MNARSAVTRTPGTIKGVSYEAQPKVDRAEKRRLRTEADALIAAGIYLQGCADEKKEDADDTDAGACSKDTVLLALLQ